MHAVPFTSCKTLFKIIKNNVFCIIYLKILHTLKYQVSDYFDEMVEFTKKRIFKENNFHTINKLQIYLKLKKRHLIYISNCFKHIK